MTPDLIIDLFKYFSKFISKDVLKKMFIQPPKSRSSGYDEVSAEVLSFTNKHVLSEFDTFVVSVNENFVSERMKNSKEYALFVEYGSFSADHTVTEGVKENVAVSVVKNFSDSNRDNISEVIHYNKCLVLLEEIIRTMSDEQQEQEFCDGALVDFPVEIFPIEPSMFYGCGGWCAKFKKINTIL